MEIYDCSTVILIDEKAELETEIEKIKDELYKLIMDVDGIITQQEKNIAELKTVYAKLIRLFDRA